jgi:hypothetical protein
MHVAAELMSSKLGLEAGSETIALLIGGGKGDVMQQAMLEAVAC